MTSCCTQLQSTALHHLAVLHRFRVRSVVRMVDLNWPAELLWFQLQSIAIIRRQKTFFMRSSWCLEVEVQRSRQPKRRPRCKENRRYIRVEPMRRIVVYSTTRSRRTQSMIDVSGEAMRRGLVPRLHFPPSSTDVFLLLSFNHVTPSPKASIIWKLCWSLALYEG